MHVDQSKKRALKEKYGSEMVFAVPFNEMTHVPDKFVQEEGRGKKSPALSFYDKKGRYILRYDAEGNNAMQQLIPYAIIRNVNNGKYLAAKRIAGDERLKESLSLGFGGHIDPQDGYIDVIMKGLYRELHEELTIGEVKETTYKGTVRDLASETSDHTGFLFEVFVTDAEIKETHKLIGQWMTKKELIDHYFKFEGWSKHYIDYLYLSN